MGIVNVTPDSFYSAARTQTTDQAIARGRDLLEMGCDIVDVGGESTRPGAEDVPVVEELARVLPVVQALSSWGRVSVDTRKALVAREAVSAGARVLNDVSGSLVEVAGELGVGYVAMHSRGTPRTMQIDPHYDDVVRDVATALEVLAVRARDAGVTDLWLDPGIGFGKTVEHNLALVAHCGEFVSLAARHGAGVLMGTSRKGFLGRMGTEDLDVGERLEGSIATAAWSLLSGVAMIRVHDVAAALQLRDLFARPLAEVAP